MPVIFTILMYNEVIMKTIEAIYDNGKIIIEDKPDIKKARVGRFTAETGKKMIPRMWEISVANRNYNGTFIFIDPQIGDKNFVAVHRDTLDITLKVAPKKEEVIITQHTGTLQVDVKTKGILFLDEQEKAAIP